MNFIRRLIQIPLVIMVIIFAVINNDFATFNLKPFNLNITISLSVLILILFFSGYLLGRLDSFVANAPLRASLRQQKKANKALNKEHEKLNEKFSDLQENLESIKNQKQQEPKIPLKQRFSEFFTFKKDNK